MKTPSIYYVAFYVVIVFPCSGKAFFFLKEKASPFSFFQPQTSLTTRAQGYIFV